MAALAVLALALAAPGGCGIPPLLPARPWAPGETLTFEVEHYHKDGHIFPLAVTANLISSGSERVILAIHRNITERKVADTALRESAAASTTWIWAARTMTTAKAASVSASTSRSRRSAVRLTVRAGPRMRGS